MTIPLQEHKQFLPPPPTLMDALLPLHHRSSSGSYCNPGIYFSLLGFGIYYILCFQLSAMDRQRAEIALVADARNQVLVAALIQQIDEALDQKLEHQNPNELLQLERLKTLLQQINNGWFRDQQTIMPAATISGSLERTRDAIRLAIRIISRSQKKRRRCIDFITCAPKISREIKEWTTTFDKLFQDLEMDLSVWLSAQKIVDEAVSQIQPVPEPDLLLQPVPDSGPVGSKIKVAEAELQIWLTQAPHIAVIGLYGMPGVGKTSLLKIIHNTHKASNVFDLVIWVTVSQHSEIPDLQCRIGESIDLELSKTCDFDIRKMKLYARLKKKKFLLIFDDVWCPLDLQEVGVGFGEGKGSKVVFSTHNRDLALMEAEESIELQTLSREEGWEMFEKIAFRGGHAPEELEEYARKIADQCAGLPVAISVVAGAMRGKTTLDEWNALASEKCRAFFSTYFESYNLMFEGTQ